MFPFDTPENIRKSKVFRCFQGDQKWTLGRKKLRINQTNLENSKAKPKNSPWWFESDYDILLSKSGKVTMGIKRSRVLAIEAFKTVNNFDNKFHAKLGPDDFLVKHDDTSYMVQKA